MTPRVVFGLLLPLSGVQLAYSKGSPDLIVIGGGGLIHQIDITDPAALKEFDHGRDNSRIGHRKRSSMYPAFAAPSRSCSIGTGRSGSLRWITLSWIMAT